jgi:hypothetical protein
MGQFYNCKFKSIVKTARLSSKLCQLWNPMSLFHLFQANPFKVTNFCCEIYPQPMPHILTFQFKLFEVCNRYDFLSLLFFFFFLFLSNQNFINILFKLFIVFIKFYYLHVKSITKLLILTHDSLLISNSKNLKSNQQQTEYTINLASFSHTVTHIIPRKKA